MRRAARWILAGAAAVAVAYGVWSRAGRRPPSEPVDLNLTGVESFGEDRGNGNLLGIQPWMVPSDYASEERFRRKLDGYLAAARKAGFLGPDTVVVLPEYLGTWLVVVGEKASVYSAATVAEATRAMAFSNLPSLLRWTIVSPAPDRTRYALFRMKARSMAATYDRVLSGLARSYGVTLVGGSIVLPDPRIRDGRLAAGSGPLYNVCVVYGPDGRAQEPVVRKAFLIADERPFLAAGKVEDLRAYVTPAGKLGVLICADAWYPEAYEALARQRADLIVAPSYVFGDRSWERPWGGYENGRPRGSQPAQGRLTEEEAWMAYAMPARLGDSGARAGMTVFLRGRLWDLGSDGESFAVANGVTHMSQRRDAAALINLWLPR